MPTALIADDESLLREHLRELLGQVWPDLTIVAEATNGLEASELLALHRPDVAFLDIKMPGLSGIEVAKRLMGSTRVVFATAYDQFAVQAFEAQAADYLLKPINGQRLGQTVLRLQAALAAAQPAPDLRALLTALTQQSVPTRPQFLQWIRASRADVTFQIAVDEVLYFQSDDKYTCVVTATGEHLIRTPLTELMLQLDPDRFWQIHRSTVVQAKSVASARREGDGRLWVSIRGHEKPLAVSRAYQHMFKQM